MITLTDFRHNHVDQAMQIAKQNYDEERGFVPTLPPVNKLPDLSDYAKYKRGVAAIYGDKLLGFFCWLEPWENHFGLYKGTWSPVHAHGAIKQNRAEIYDRLYQVAAEKLVSNGIFSHSVTLYEHDSLANDSFFQNGFGRRCVDAIRETTSIISPSCNNVTFRQAGKDDAEIIADMINLKNIHLNQSPMFMPCFDIDSDTDIIKDIESSNYKYFIAFNENKAAAYYCIQKSGENFVCDDVSVMNICGAYTLPEFRGKGISAGLLSWLMNWLQEHGYSLCGVDFECFNFTARKFWSKYFTAYTNGAVRRIDERIFPGKAALTKKRE